MNNLITACVKIEVSFLEDEIKEFVGNPKLTEQQFIDIADCLIHNLEGGAEEWEGTTVNIERANFNDCFGDMEDDLIEEFSVDPNTD
jgi:hypothetical protein